MDYVTENREKILSNVTPAILKAYDFEVAGHRGTAILAVFSRAGSPCHFQFLFATTEELHKAVISTT